MADTPILLCGSIPLADADTVFDCICETMGPALDRVPDGETGVRSTWIGWQNAVFARQEALERLPEKQRDYQLKPPFRFKSGKTAVDLSLRPLGFATEALKSYALFHRRRDEGRLRSDARFQVSLPTPFAPVYSFTAYEAQASLYPVYEAALLEELQEITSAIPASDLALQWDVATEMSIFERVYNAPLEDPDGELINRLIRLGNAVPEAVELGYHLCYGSMYNKHWQEPEDLSKCVWVANKLASGVSRQIDWMHMPVPIGRSDDAYFSPLAELAIASETTLFLGLIHLSDGTAGAGKRATAAKKFCDRFGLAAECGFGRMKEAEIRPLMDLHARLASGD